MANENARKGAVPQFEKERFVVVDVVFSAKLIEELGQEFMDDCLHRHCCGVWGLVDELSQRRNERTLLAGPRLVTSEYRAPNGRRVQWVTFLDSAKTYVVALND